MNHLEINDNAREHVNDMVRRGEESFRFRHLRQPTLMDQLSTLFRNLGAKLTPTHQHPRNFRKQAKKA